MKWITRTGALLWNWLGRLAAAAGAALEGLDVTGVSGPIKSVAGAILGHQYADPAYSSLVLLCFAVSYWRHHQAATTVAYLRGQVAALSK